MANYYIKHKAVEVTVSTVPNTIVSYNGYANQQLYIDGKTVNSLSASQYATLDTNRFTFSTSPF